jgi:hypothetical protein
MQRVPMMKRRAGKMPTSLVCGDEGRNGTSAIKNQFLYRQADITGDLPEQRRSEITTLVNRNRRPPTVRVTVLNMRAALANCDKAKSFEQTTNFRGLENRK